MTRSHVSRSGSATTREQAADATEQLSFGFDDEPTPAPSSAEALPIAPPIVPSSAPSSAPSVSSSEVASVRSTAPRPSLPPSSQPVWTSVSMREILDDWAQRGWLRELDRAFAVFLADQVADAPALLLLAAALASHQLGRGHVCLDLADALHDPRFALSLPPDERRSDVAASVRSIDGANVNAVLSDADDPAAREPVTPDQLLAGVDLAAWCAALDNPSLVEVRDADDPGPANFQGTLGQGTTGDTGSASGASPLVRVGTRVYLRRYWRYEREVRRAVLRRASASVPGLESDNDLVPSRRFGIAPSSNTTITANAANAANGANAADTANTTMRRLLDILFDAAPGKDASPTGTDEQKPTNWQKVACALMARRRFGIVTGGPGTGKTTTVVRLLALLQGLALGAGERPLRIRLAAPTGKAAARLNESIARAVDALPFAALAGVVGVIGVAGGATNGVDEADATIPLRESIPTEVTTLHRLLGSRPDSRRFRHHADAPLALDVLVVDEASMVDLEMMAALLAALPDKARLILLGDKDQLASVEAGAVLGELCRRAQGGHYTPATCDWLRAASGERIATALQDEQGTALDQVVAMLRVSHRFSAESGIGRLAETVNAGDIAGTRRVWRQGFADLASVRVGAAPATVARSAAQAAMPRATPAGDVFAAVNQAALRTLVVDGYAQYLREMRRDAPDFDDTAVGHDIYDAWAARVLSTYSQFQVLCALRRGVWGVEGLNRQIVQALHEAGLIVLAKVPLTPWYEGRPVLVTRNDYGLGLMNGDIGITLMGPPQNGRAGTTLATGHVPHMPQRARPERLRVAFPAGDGSGGIKWVLPSRLQAVETVFAMTVHKSQGSEFAHAALILPERLNPILTRELVYTAITRARERLTLAYAGQDDRVFEEAISRRVLRASGLLEGVESD